MSEFVTGERDAFRTIDRRMWRKYLFYVDLLVWGVFGAALALMMGNLYEAGWHERAGDSGAMTGAWWDAMIALAFAVGSLSWIFYRFWRNGYLARRRPF